MFCTLCWHCTWYLASIQKKIVKAEVRPFNIFLHMKRDMDIVRALLLAEEGSDEAALKDYSRQELAYNAVLMIDAKLVAGHAEPVIGEKYPSNYQIYRLTWAGHDFLDAARNETIWNKAKEKILKPSVSWTFTILLEYLKIEARRLIGLPENN